MWNNEIFGNIFKWKRRLSARASGIQKALEFHQTNNLIQLEVIVKKDLEKVLIRKKSSGIISLERNR